MSGRVHLRTERFSVEVEPEIGGALATFDVIRKGEALAVLRHAPTIMKSALDAACFPLVPFANRIRGGGFVCDGRRIDLPANMAGDRSPIHGQGWQSAWRVNSQSESEADLGFRHEPGPWPWIYDARQWIKLVDDGLELTLECVNLSDDPMPCGLGYHPYYPCNDQTRLRAIVTHAWTIDADVLPVERVPAVGRYDLADRLACGQGLDNGFDGWGHEAEILWPDREFSVTMRSQDATRFQLYSPPQGGIIAAEPVQNANAALNEPQADWPKLGITMLGRGESVRLRVHWRVTDQG